MKPLSEDTPLRLTVGILVVILGGFGSFLYLKFQSDASASAIQELRQVKETDRTVLTQIQVDMAEIKSDVKSIRREMPSR
jgi:Tfp pilus assembly protein PilO